MGAPGGPPQNRFAEVKLRHKNGSLYKCSNDGRYLEHRTARFRGRLGERAVQVDLWGWGRSSRGMLEAEPTRRFATIDFPSIPRPAATAGGLLSHSRFPACRAGQQLSPQCERRRSSRPGRPVFDFTPLCSCTTSTTLSYNCYCIGIHTLTWRPTQRMETAMLPTTLQTWHPSSPAFLKLRPK